MPFRNLLSSWPTFAASAGGRSTVPCTAASVPKDGPSMWPYR
nr:MAG TPA: hypothetical protein [Caudoviricetes sp.]